MNHTSNPGNPSEDSNSFSMPPSGFLDFGDNPDGFSFSIQKTAISKKTTISKKGDHSEMELAKMTVSETFQHNLKYWVEEICFMSTGI